MFSFVDEDHKETEEECEELVRRIHFVTSEEGTLFDVDRRSLFDFVSQSETEQRSEAFFFIRARCLSAGQRMPRYQVIVVGFPVLLLVSGCMTAYRTLYRSISVHFEVHRRKMDDVFALINRIC
jgi:hypothetical protein